MALQTCELPAAWNRSCHRTCFCKAGSCEEDSIEEAGDVVTHFVTWEQEVEFVNEARNPVVIPTHPEADKRQSRHGAHFGRSPCVSSSRADYRLWSLDV